MVRKVATDLICPTPKCGKHLEVTIKTWRDVDATGALIDRGLGGMTQVYCADDHALGDLETDAPTPAEIRELLEQVRRDDATHVQRTSRAEVRRG